MKRTIAIVLALLVCVGRTSAQSVSLSWNDCVGTSGATTSQLFDCTSPTDQVYDLVIQFRTGAEIPDFSAVVADVEFQRSGFASLSPFWHFEPAGGCNAIPVGLELLGAEPGGCVATGVVSPWQSLQLDTLIIVYGADFHRPGNGFFRMGAGSYTRSTHLAASVDHYAFHMRFHTGRRNNCSGCGDPGELWVDRVRLEVMNQAPIDILGDPEDRVTVNQPDVVAARAVSWAQLKSLYR